VLCTEQEVQAAAPTMQEINIYRHQYQRQQEEYRKTHRYYEMDKPFVLIKAYPDKKLLCKRFLVNVRVCRLHFYIFLIFFNFIFHKNAFFLAYYNAL
jgi:hypothetical protein